MQLTYLGYWRESQLPKCSLNQWHCTIVGSNCCEWFLSCPHPNVIWYEQHSASVCSVDAVVWTKESSNWGMCVCMLLVLFLAPLFTDALHHPLSLLSSGCDGRPWSGLWRRSRRNYSCWRWRFLVRSLAPHSFSITWWLKCTLCDRERSLASFPVLIPQLLLFAICTTGIASDGS